jgi:hypothetical protein
LGSNAGTYFLEMALIVATMALSAMVAGYGAFRVGAAGRSRGGGEHLARSVQG